MSRPTNLPDWATNANYGAGPYSGNANKNKPPSGNIAEGFDPGAGMPASWFNWLFNNHGQWNDYHDNKTRWDERLFSSATGITSSQNPVTNFGQLALTLSGSSPTANFKDVGVGASGFNGRSVALAAGTSTDYAFISSSSKIIGFGGTPAKLFARARGVIAIDTNGLSHATVFWGFSDQLNMSNLSSNFCGFTFNVAPGPHWRLQNVSTGGGTNITITPSIGDPSAGVFETIELRYFGASTPAGVANGSAYVEWWLGGALAGNSNLASNQVLGANCYFGGGLQSAGVATSTTYVGAWIVETDYTP
jgi:hypothetical protein